MIALLPPPIYWPDPATPAGACGIQRVEVGDDESSLLVTYVPGDALDRRPDLLDVRSYALTGGSRLHPRITAIERHGDGARLTLDGAGDLSVYALTLITEGINPFFSSRRFRFRLGCEDPFDCRSQPAVGTEILEAVPIDYLAKDYASFRQSLLDLLRTRAGGWTERSEADIGIALLELIAHTGDLLSYTQDRVGNEAFLASARQRRSVRGHLAMLGYDLDEGASAHTWLQFQVSRSFRLAPGFAVTTADEGERPVVFESVTPLVLRPEHNELALYDWGIRDWCIELGSTAATLRGSVATLRTGDELVFVDTQTEARDIVRLSATPVLLHKGEPLPYGSAVRARYAYPPSAYAEAGAGYPEDLTLIQWSALTPLTHDYCVATSVVRGNVVLATHGATVTERITLEQPSALAQEANVVVVPRNGAPGATFQLDASGFVPDEAVTRRIIDPQGRQVEDTFIADRLGAVLASYTGSAGAPEGTWQVRYDATQSKRTGVARWRVTKGATTPSRPLRAPRLRVALSEGPLAYIDTVVRERSEGTVGDFAYARESVPAIRTTIDGVPWSDVVTLLENDVDAEAYRVESDNAGRAELVFGRGGEPLSAGGFGRRPPNGSTLEITYRVGLGRVGNVPADALVSAPKAESTWFVSVTNPLAASGGREPESLEHARRLAVASARKRLVAVTAADYQEATMHFRDPSGSRVVARSNVSFRWTGSWFAANVSVDPRAATELPPETGRALLSFLDGRRLAGYDLRLARPAYVPLQLQVVVCTRRGFVPTDVKRAVELALGGLERPDGRRGFFHPDNFSFGDRVSISQLLAAAMAVTGVESVVIDVLAPLHAPRPAATTAAVKRAGELAVSSDQIVQLDNDPNHPERGRLMVVLA